MPQSSAFNSLIVTQTRRALSGVLSEPSASNTTLVKAADQPLFRQQIEPVDRNTDFEKVERLVMIWAAGVVISVIGHLPAFHNPPGGWRIRHLLPPHRHHGVLDEPVADRHGNIGAVIGRPAAPRMILSVHSRGISEAAGASPSEGGPDADTVSGRQGRRRQPLAPGLRASAVP
jgi:hypothetical protein